MHPIVTTHICQAICFVAALCALCGSAASGQLLPEERITTDSARNYEMSRNPNHSMIVARDGTVHLVFWEGEGYGQTSPAHPSTVWYCRRSPSGRWGRLEMVDNSYTSTGARVGGRHPSLILRASGEVRVFWHDYRNCSPLKKWMNNTELYMDSRAAGGSFSANDVRLTTTTASHDGDNSYVPQVVTATTGEILLAWYDYHFNPNLADIFLMRSDGLGRFSPSLPIDSWRLTNATQRGDGVSYTLPDVAVDTSRTAHLTWTRDNAAGYRVYYARQPIGGQLMAPVVLSATGGAFMDPPHITISPQGDIWVIWTEHIAQGDFILLGRLRRGAAAFDAAMRLTGNSSDQFQGDMKADSRGLLHVAWVDGRSGRDEIFCGVFDPASKALLSEIKISEGVGNAARPCIAVAEGRGVCIAWADDRNGNGQIYFRAIEFPAKATPLWNLYR
jgi:hypothetical protein